jgi:hypothetical protein
MKQKRHLLAVAFSCLLSTLLYAQIPCAFDTIQSSSGLQEKQHIHRNNISQNRDKLALLQHAFNPNPLHLSGNGCAYTRYLIPVVVHIDTTGNTITMSDAQVQNQLDVVNTEFEAYGIQVCLATKKPDGSSFNGVNRTGGASIDNRIEFQDTSFARKAYFDPERYLNIYVVRTILNEDNSNSTYLGYNNRFPGQGGVQGIFIRYTRFGDYASCSGCTTLDTTSRGKVLVHELGHYLGLWHTFDGGCTAGNTSATCDKKGDMCCDTRPVSAQNNACPLPSPNTSCTYHLSIPENRSNYMEYSGEDCLDNFTPNQVSIMFTTLETKRRILVNAENVDTLQLTCCSNMAAFSSNTNFMCATEADTLYLTAFRPDTACIYTWTIKDSTNNTVLFDTTTSSNRFNVLLNGIAFYNISLRVINSQNDTMYITRNNHLQIADCGVALPSPQANWYFGYYAGLKFTSNGVFKDVEPYNKRTSGNIHTSEGAISISNNQGHILFYAGGRYNPADPFFHGGKLDVYNRYYKAFQTSPLKGDWSSAQTAVSFPVPYSLGKYYLFAVCGDNAYDVSFQTYDSRGMRYSIIDTSVVDPPNLQYGEVESGKKDIIVPAPSGSDINVRDSAFMSGEMITAIPQCNNTDYWLLVNDNSPDSFLNHHKIIIFKVDSAGIHHHNTTAFIPTKEIGQLKASPDGTKVSAPGLIFDFNRITGTLTLIDSMVSPFNVSSSSFSPDSRSLYYLVVNGAYTSLYQYSFDDSTHTYITDHETVSDNGMQLGPDGKIYISRIDEEFLSVIQYPNKKARFSGDNRVGYAEVGPSLASGGVGGTCSYGLPNMVDAKFPSDIAKEIVYSQANCYSFKFSNTLCCAENFKWYFGDGDSATTKSTMHTYDSLKSYVVILIADGDTLIDTVEVGITAPIIAGSGVSGTICDTTNHQYNYSIGNREDEYTYDWSISSPNTLNVDPSGNANVDWKESNSWLKVVAISPTGCIDSSTITIQLGPGIYSNTIMFDTTDCDDILGSTPWALWTYTYSWQRSYDSTTWVNIPSQTAKDLITPVYFRTTYIRRVVQDSVCTSYSNILKTSPSIDFTISAVNDTMCPHGELTINGSTPCSNNSSITYRWQYKAPTDTVFNDIVASYGQLSTLQKSEWLLECSLRRYMVSAGDTGYTDTAYIVVRDYFNIIDPIGPVPYFHRICSNTNMPMMEGYNACALTYWQFQWESCTDTTNNSWQDIYNATGNNFQPGHISITTYYRRRASFFQSGQPQITTHSPIFTMQAINPQIVQQPQNTTRNEGQDAVFVVQFEDMTVVKWQQSFVSFGVTFLSDIADSDNDTLVVKADHCRHGKKYVAILQNLCTLGEVYSDTATLSVTTYNYDLWSKDNDLDNSSEPSVGFIWNSPDTWNRRSNDAGTVHQNAEHRVSAPNYVYVKVRNIGGSGQQASVPSKVYLYWTFANTGEKWTKHWVHDFDADSITGNWRTYQGVKHALGSLISILDLSALNAGTDTTLYVPWYPPNPGVINNGTDTVNADVCFLSRIVTCEEAPYGMVIHPEVADVGFNVRYNNNIITKNFVVYDTLAGNGKTRWGGNGNPVDDARIGRLVFTADNCDYFDYGTVLLHLDAGMQEAWYANGANGSGFTVLNDSTLQIDTCVAVLDEILYSANQQAWLGVQFDESVGVPITEEINEFFTFNLQQYFDVEDEDTSVGGIVYGVPVLLYPPESGESQRRNTPVKDTKANQLAFSAFPNPFNNVLKVVYSLPKDENVTITLTNLLGQTIQTVEQNEFKTAGIHRLDINTVNLTEGIYFITFKAGNEIKQKKIVLIR